MVIIEHTPQNIHRLEFIRPTDAAASAPRRPTIDASIYCMMIVESCAMMAGADSFAVSATCWRRLRCSPFDICEMWLIEKLRKVSKKSASDAEFHNRENHWSQGFVIKS